MTNMVYQSQIYDGYRANRDLIEDSGANSTSKEMQENTCGWVLLKILLLRDQ